MREGEPKKDDEAQEPERISGLMRVAGVTPGKEGEVLSDIKTEYFDKQDTEGFRRVEREKTPEELETINRILSVIPDFIRKYGGTPITIRPEHIHIIDINKLTDEQKKWMGSTRGRYYFDYQTIGVMPHEDNMLNFAQRVAHESLHFNAFQSADFDPKADLVSSRVEGVLTRSKKTVEGRYYFNGINEAITEELAKRFNEEYFGSIPELESDIVERNKFVAGLKNKNAAKEIKSFIIKQEGGVTRARAEEYSYKPERKKLHKIMREILQNNSGEFESEEDVFKIFAEAYLTGKRLKMARLIEKTFGKGSFRKLGEETEILSQPKN